MAISLKELQNQHNKRAIVKNKPSSTVKSTTNNKTYIGKNTGKTNSYTQNTISKRATATPTVTSNNNVYGLAGVVKNIVQSNASKNKENTTVKPAPKKTSNQKSWQEKAKEAQSKVNIDGTKKTITANDLKGIQGAGNYLRANAEQVKKLTNNGKDASAVNNISKLNEKELYTVIEKTRSGDVDSAKKKLSSYSKKNKETEYRNTVSDEYNRALRQNTLQTVNDYNSIKNIDLNTLKKSGAYTKEELDYIELLKSNDYSGNKTKEEYDKLFNDSDKVVKDLEKRINTMSLGDNEWETVNKQLEEAKKKRDNYDHMRTFYEHYNLDKKDEETKADISKIKEDENFDKYYQKGLEQIKNNFASGDAMTTARNYILKGQNDAKAMSMNEEDRKTYIALVGKGDLESAKKLLSLTEKDINQNLGEFYAQGIINDENDVTRHAKVYISDFLSGVSNLETSIRQLGNLITGNPRSVSKNILQSARETYYPTLDDSAQFVSNIVENIGNMVPAVATGGAAGMVTMGTNIFGNTYRESFDEGNSVADSLVYASANTALELTMEKILGGFTSLEAKNSLASVLSSKIGKAIDNVTSTPKSNAILKTAVRLGLEANAEGTEEFFQEFFDNIVRNIVFNENNEVDILDPKNVEAYIMGAITSFAMNGVSVSGDIISIKETGKDLNNKKSKFNINSVLDSIEKTSIGNSYEKRLANNIRNKIANGEKISNIDAGILFNAAEQSAVDYSALDLFFKGELKLSDISQNVLENAYKNIDEVNAKFGQNFDTNLTKEEFRKVLETKDKTKSETSLSMIEKYSSKEVAKELEAESTNNNTENKSELIEDYTEQNENVNGEQTQEERTLYANNLKAKSSTPFTEDFPKADTLIFWGQTEYDKSSDRTKAKNGDMQAAKRIVDKYLTDEFAQKIKRKYQGSTIVAVDDVLGDNINQLPAAFAEALAQKTGLTLDDKIVKINKTSHAKAKDGFQRMTQRAEFAGEVENKTYYLIVDDFVSMGGTVADLRNYIESNGGKVVGVATLGASNEQSLQIAPTKETIARLESERSEIENVLREYGIANKLEDLTEAEARKLANTTYTLRKQGSGDNLADGIRNQLDKRKPKSSSQNVRQGSINQNETTQQSGFSMPENKKDSITSNKNFAEDTNISDEVKAAKAKSEKLVMTEKHKPTKQDRTTKIEEAKDATIRKFVDSGYTFKRASRVAGDRTIYDLYDNARRSRQTAAYSIGYSIMGKKTYQTDINGKKMGDSIETIFEPVVKESKKNPSYQRDFFEYLLHYHNIDRMAQGKPVFGNDVTAENSRAIIEKYEQTNPEFKEIAEKVWKYNDNMLDIRVQGGLITEEHANILREMYPHYVPIYRDINSSKGVSSKGTKINTVVKKATGSDLPIVPVSDAMIQQTMQVYNAVAQNKMMNRLYDDYIDNPEKMSEFINDVKDVGIAYDIDDTTGTTYAKRKSTSHTNDVTFYVNGKPMTVNVNTGIADGINSLNVTGDLIKPLAKINRAFKSLVTSYNIAFLARNFFRDFGDSLFYTSNVKGFLKNYPKAWSGITKNSELWQQYQALGGVNSSFFDSAKGIKTKSNIIKRYTLDKIELANLVIEQVPRFTEFMNVLEQQGKLPDGTYSRDSLMKAMHASADITVNFGKSGSITNVLNREFVPFLNASIQGSEKFIRQFKRSGGKAWFGLACRAAVLGVLPSILNNMLYDDDEEYKLLSQRIKDENYVFKVNGQWVKLPKGRLLSFIGSIATRTVDAAQGKGFDVEGLMEVAGNSIAPTNPFTSNIFSPIINAVNNTTWYGGQIDSAYDLTRTPADRYSETTDAFSKWLGKALNISPKRINYVLDSYSGIFGDIVLPALSEDKQKSNVAQNLLNTFISSFTTDPIYSNDTSELFYEKKDEITYLANGQPESEIKNVEDWLLTYMNKQSGIVSDIYKEIDKNNANGNTNTDDNKILRMTVNGVYQTATATVDILEDNIRKYYNIDSNADIDIQKIQSQKAYIQGYRDTFGAQVAIKETLSKEEYEKAENANKKGLSYESYLDYYLKTREDDEKYRNENGDLAITNSDKREILSKGNYNDKETELLYSIFVEEKDATKEKTISYAVSKGIGAKTFLKRQIQKESEVGDKEDTTNADLYYDENGNVITKTENKETTVSYTKRRDQAHNLLNSGYTEAEKKFFYQSENPSDDKFVYAMIAGIGVDEYLQAQENQVNVVSDKNENGETVTGSKKEKYIDYLNGTDLNEAQKIICIALGIGSQGSKWKITSSEKATVVEYINNLDTTESNKKLLLDKLEIDKSTSSGGGGKGRSGSKKSSSASVKLSTSAPKISGTKKTASTTKDIVKNVVKDIVLNSQNDNYVAQKKAIEDNMFMTAKQKAAMIDRLKRNLS